MSASVTLLFPPCETESTDRSSRVTCGSTRRTSQEPGIGTELATSAEPAGHRDADVEAAQCRCHPGQDVGAYRQEAAEADVHDGRAVGREPRVDLRVRRLGPDGRAEKGVARQQSSALGRVQGLRIVEQQQVPGLAERVLARGRRRVEGAKGLVPARGEGVPYSDAEGVEVLESSRVRCEAPGPRRRKAVDLATRRTGPTDGRGRRPRAGRPALVSASRALKARWSTSTWSGRTRSTTAATSLATRSGSHRRSSPRAAAWKARVSTAPTRVAAKNPRRESSSPRGWSSARMTPGFDPRPSWRCSRSKPNPRTISSVADPVATTTRSPTCCHAVARVASG